MDLRPACLCSKDSCARSVPVHLAPQPQPQTPPETRVAWWWHVYTPLLFLLYRHMHCIHSPHHTRWAGLCYSMAASHATMPGRRFYPCR